MSKTAKRPANPKSRHLDSLLVETRRFAPPAAFAKQANIRDPRIWATASKDSDRFWASWAKQLDWFKPFKTVSKGKMGAARWFLGGQLNACYNALDRHVSGSRRWKTALLWVGEDQKHRALTYYELREETARVGNMLKKLGVKKGDRVAIYMGMIPELPIAVLACARIGAVHSVIFGGFSASSIRDRVNDMGAKALICADGARRKGSVVDLKKAVDEALEGTVEVPQAGACPSLESVLVFEHVGNEIQWRPGRDHSWKQLALETGTECPCEPMDSEDTLFLLYTSGSTGKPKGIRHSTAGYLTGALATAQWVFDLKDDDLYWCTADLGWVTGHTYLAYGPFLNGATCFVYESTPDFPEKDVFWRLIEKWGVTIFYTAPTTIRACMQWGDDLVDRHALKSLRLLGSVGEPINPEAWMWYQEHVGKKRCPIVDTWWQTETGSIMITPLPGLVPTKPGSATKAFPGTFPEVVDDNGETLEEGAGYLVYRRPWPSMLRGIWGNDKLFNDTYFSRFKGAYFAGDAARLDKDGYLWLMGRVDDVVNVSGHRIGTMEVESALVDHPAVAEAAVIGRDDALKGQALAAFVILRAGHEPSDALRKELREHVGKVIGPIAKPDDLILTPGLPKTRSGKIMRRLLRDVAEGRALGDVTTLNDPGVVEHIKAEYERLKTGAPSAPPEALNSGVDVGEAVVGNLDLGAADVVPEPSSSGGRTRAFKHEETNLSEEILHLFDRDPQKLSLAEGDLLFSVGDASNGKMYVLVEGQAEIIVSGYIVELAKPGAIIGELALIDQEPRSGTIRCVTDCSFAEVDEKRFLSLIQQTPIFAMALLKVLAARLRRVNRTM